MSGFLQRQRSCRLQAGGASSAGLWGMRCSGLAEIRPPQYLVALCFYFRTRAQADPKAVPELWFVCYKPISPLTPHSPSPLQSWVPGQPQPKGTPKPAGDLFFHWNLLSDMREALTPSAAGKGILWSWLSMVWSSFSTRPLPIFREELGLRMAQHWSVPYLGQMMAPAILIFPTAPKTSGAVRNHLGGEKTSSALLWKGPTPERAIVLKSKEVLRWSCRACKKTPSLKAKQTKPTLSAKQTGSALFPEALQIPVDPAVTSASRKSRTSFIYKTKDTLLHTGGIKSSQLFLLTPRPFPWHCTP